MQAQLWLKLSTFSTVKRVSRDWGNKPEAMKESVSTAVEMKKRRKRSVDIPESVISAKSVQEEPLFTEEKIDFDHVAGVLFHTNESIRVLL